MLDGADVGHTLRVRVTGTNAAGTASDTSSPSGIVGSTAPRNVTLPEVAGDPIVGATLTVTSGMWDGSGLTLTYQWQRCSGSGDACVDLAGDTAATHAAVADDAGHRLRVPRDRRRRRRDGDRDEQPDHRRPGHRPGPVGAADRAARRRRRPRRTRRTRRPAGCDAGGPAPADGNGELRPPGRRRRRRGGRARSRGGPRRRGPHGGGAAPPRLRRPHRRRAGRRRPARCVRDRRRGPGSRASPPWRCWVPTARCWRA